MNSKYEIIGNTDISDIGQTVTGAISNIADCPLADPDMYSNTGWLEPTWTNSVTSHFGGYKIKGDYVYINARLKPNSTEVDFKASNGLFYIPSNYVPADADNVYIWTTFARYCSSWQIRNDGLVIINGGWNSGSYLGLIGFYKYR